MPAVPLPVEPGSAGAARRLLRDAVAGQEESESVDDAVLLISELVTNAVHHTRHLLLVRVVLQDGLLRVEVTDDHPDLPSPSVREVSATGGRGLQFVDDLAAQWGVIPAADRKTVWFEIQV